MGSAGTDIILSPQAKQLIPFDVECKNQEKLNIWDAIKQCEDNTASDRIALLVFSRNFDKKYAVIELEKLLNLVRN